MVWKNGVGQPVAPGRITASDLFVDGQDVYVTGYEEIENADTTRDRFNWRPNILPRYWKNGKAVVIPIIRDNSLPDQIKMWRTLSAIHVQSGDVYVVGDDFQIDPSMIINATRIAKYWKNGQEFRLTNGEKATTVTSIFVDNNDVYVSGVVEMAPPWAMFTLPKGICWKNGVEIKLPGEKKM